MSKEFTLTDLVNSYDEDDNIISVPPSGDDLDSPDRIAAQLEEDIKRGQVWLASDYGCFTDSGTATDIAESNDLYVMIVDVNADDPRLASVIPLSNDLRAETDDSLVIEQGSPLGIPMVAWPTIPAIIPIRLLSKPLKQFSPATADAIITDDPSKSASSDVVRRGNSQAGSESPFVENREDTIAVLVLWHAMCAKLPELRSEEERGSMAPDRAAYVRSLVEILGLSFEDAGAVVDGRLAMSREQEQRLTDAGVDPARFRTRSFHLPKDLLIEIEQPAYQQLAQQYSSTHEGDARLGLAKDAFMLAARKSGYGRNSWRSMIQQAMKTGADSDGTRK
ncbi:hypothetical protein [Bifidobacterium leontopitheci]|uniref:Uncharacterized protein n=1 Tax=Bifidobacterium leontopitheci TaxID=2650774 RepID=A0A6I1GKR9_9BIFI|nr:hypothetical protein [Bifidobacterium leontopitheci]KAB7790039.1 hypothetical protein F7D09_1457 [Bifidobacterium leontopitheci]